MMYPLSIKNEQWQWWWSAQSDTRFGSSAAPVLYVGPTSWGQWMYIMSQPCVRSHTCGWLPHGDGEMPARNLGMRSRSMGWLPNWSVSSLKVVLVWGPADGVGHPLDSEFPQGPPARSPKGAPKYHETR